MATAKAVRIEIVVGAPLHRLWPYNASVKAKRTFQVDATPAEKWRGMTTIYTFTLDGTEYSVSARYVNRLGSESEGA